MFLFIFSTIAIFSGGLVERRILYGTQQTENNFGVDSVRGSLPVQRRTTYCRKSNP
jgi:hypothetical protein